MSKDLVGVNSDKVGSKAREGAKAAISLAFVLSVGFSACGCQKLRRS